MCVTPNIKSSTAGTHTFERKKIFQIVKEKLKTEKIKFVLSNLTKVLKSFCKRIGNLWTKSYRSKLIILKEHKKWFEYLETIQLEAKSVGKELLAPSQKRGRPAKEFFKSSERTKRHKIS